MQNSKIKLLVVIDAWFPHFGGGQVHVWELSKQLAQMGYEVTILTRNLGKWEEKFKGIRVIRIGHFRKFSNIIGRFEFLLLAFFYCLEFKYDILSLQAFSPGLLAPIIKLLKPRKPVVFTAHGTGYKISGLGFSGKTLENLVFYQIKYDLEVTVAKNTFTKKTSTQKVKVIPNGVDIKRFSQAIRTRKKINNLIYLGRLVEDKGVDLLIKAFQLLNKHNLGLIIVGEGAELEKLKKMAGKSKIVFKGKLEGKDLIRQLYEADLMVMPSRVEGQPIRLLEAWAAKLPVLATRAGDNALYIKDGKNGFLTDSNYLSISKDIERVCRFKNLNKIADAGFLNVQEYTWKKIADKISENYLQVIRDVKSSAFRKVLNG